MSQGSNRISNSIEMNAAVVELLEDVMKENDGKEGKENVIFSQKAKTLVKEIADFSRNTRIYREAEARREEFRNETKRRNTSTDIWLFAGQSSKCPYNASCKWQCYFADTAA